MSSADHPRSTATRFIHCRSRAAHRNPCASWAGTKRASSSPSITRVRCTERACLSFPACLSGRTCARTASSAIINHGKTPKRTVRSMKHLLFVSPDSITEALLAAGMLPLLAERFPGLSVTVACPESIRAIYRNAPFVRNVVTWRPDLLAEERDYQVALGAKIAAVKSDVCVHARTQRDPYTDALA